MERRSGLTVGAIVLLVIGAASAVVVPKAWDWWDPPNPRYVIMIDQPKRPVTGRLQVVRGTAGFPSNQPLSLWIVVQGLAGGGRAGYWPQGAARLDPNRSNGWSCDIALGSPDEREIGLYKIWVVLVEPQSQAILRKFVETRLIKGSDTPMESWPVDVRRVSIQVERKRAAKPKRTSRGVLVSDNDRRRPAWCKWPPPATPSA
jgi:hypothetical protein